ncbi:vitamin K epoxide reductase family protein [Candidatus Uhrbacteria bacterium]|nr:vitamin K epoxide reductase family protein [Candidatus Uhrbacteria bacterium]
MNTTPDQNLTAIFPKWLIWTMAGIAFAGFADAAYLTANHYFGIPLICTIVHGCDIVTTSSYSLLFGIPVALLGLFYYLMVFLLFAVAIDTQKKKFASLAMMVTPAGLVASLYFLYLQIFVIRALCFYCLISVGTSALLFILGMVGLFRYAKKDVSVKK